MHFLLVSFIVGTAMSQPRTRSGQLNTRIPNSCSTLTGDKCIFPFTYQGVEYYRCTYADSPPHGVPHRWTLQVWWSPTSGATCDTGSLSSCQPETISVPSCTAESGPYADEPCVFPFRYNGVTYTSCTTQDKDNAWCSTRTTVAGTHVPGYYGYCPSSCPGAESNSNTTSCNEADSAETFISERGTCFCNNGVQSWEARHTGG
eukprot:TRINITY_DN962_c0_g1_i4.p1 TRINITY_DN962_c0_g1~~TRINITY_DN962_c0_g1_i4.p1  ORF type:complete len:203 (-),score=35.50 TRINITY_DN962_c0_g1_i4:2-610(-)